MAYDLYVVRTSHWIRAAENPITKADVDALIENDSELGWSKADFVDMKEETGAVERFYMILWNGVPCFWWYKSELLCSGADEAQIRKLLDIAHVLDARVVGDDGEIYELGKSLFGGRKIITRQAAPEA